jgi:4,5-dihydroxyphthalate decarboxylase
VRLFPDFQAVEQDYYRRTRIFPIMHLVAIRKELHEKNPALAPSLYDAFGRAKERALARMHETGALRAMVPWLQVDLAVNDAVFGGDPFAYGIEPNRATLEALVAYMHEQGLIAKPIPVEELFVTV